MKPAIQEILMDRLLGAPPPVSENVPLFVAELSPELQLQLCLKHEEAKQAALAIEELRTEADLRAGAIWPMC